MAATPEEWVRQKLLRRMISSLGYPKGLLSVEVTLTTVKRRADIVCYANLSTFSPLLVVECKAATLSLEAEAQVFGYNSLFGAPFICLAGGDEVATLWLEGGQMKRIPFLPAYEELLHAAKSLQ